MPLDLNTTFVSIFGSCRDPVPAGSMTLGQLFDYILGNDLRERTEEVKSTYAETLDRELRAGMNEDEAHKAAKKAIDELKKNLPAVTWSGKFSRRNANSLTQHSGILCLDIDDLFDPTEMAEVWAELCEQPDVLFCFRSPSGVGIKFLVRIPADARQHLAAFKTVQKKFSDWLGVEIDPSGKDTCRLCFLAHDPEAVIHPEAGVFEPDPEFLKAETPARRSADNSQKKNVNVNENENEVPGRLPEQKHAEYNCSQMRRMLSFMDAIKLDYRDWLNVGIGLHNWSGGGQDGLDLWHEWSAKDDARYDPDVLDQKWESFQPREGGVTVGTIIKLAKEGGWTRDRKPSDWFDERFPALQSTYGRAVEESVDGYEYENAAGEVLKGKRTYVNGLNEDFLAATLGLEGAPDAPVVYLPVEKAFFRYDPKAGIYAQVQAAELAARVSEQLLGCAKDCRSKDVDTSNLEFKLRRTRILDGVIKRAEGLLAVEHNFFDRHPGLIPCANGVLRLSDRKLLKFSPKWHFLGKLTVPYNSSAQCPEWLAVQQRALPDDDIDSLQKLCGIVIFQLPTSIREE